MAKIQFVKQRFNSKSHVLIKQVNGILEEYQAQDLCLSLRQLYYQLVSRGFIPNTIPSYKRLGALIANAREAGLVDWDAIEDRTRHAQQVATWGAPGEIVESAASQFKIDLWRGQDVRPEVWVEKDALAGVLGATAAKLRVACLACKGYVSSSAMFDSGYRRFREIIASGQTPVIIHLGDHDPSGLDMTRDIERRMTLFTGQAIEVRRIALNMDQIKKFTPPPNPAKETDARYGQYVEQYGPDCWELDCLEPKYLRDITSEAVLSCMTDPDLFKDRQDLEQKGRDSLGKIAAQYDRIQDFLRNK